MISTEETMEYLTRTLAEYFLRADKIGLKRIQTTAGVLMAAAESLKDKETAFHFRQIAAQAANKIEELEEEF
jgi:hypothetical protein